MNKTAVLQQVAVALSPLCAALLRGEDSRALPTVEVLGFHFRAVRLSAPRGVPGPAWRAHFQCQDTDPATGYRLGIDGSASVVASCIFRRLARDGRLAT